MDINTVRDINTIHQQQKDFWRDECMKLKEENKKLKEELKITESNLIMAEGKITEAIWERDQEIKELKAEL